MALDHTSLSANINNTYNTLKNDKQQDNINQVPYPKAPGTAWMDNFKVHYDNDANNGVFSSSHVIMAHMPELLIFDNNAFTCNGPNMMAAKITAYWEAQLTKGPGVISVTNDATKIKAPIEGYLCSRSSVTSNPPYDDLFTFIENQVKTIVWKAMVGVTVIDVTIS